MPTNDPKHSGPEYGPAPGDIARYPEPRPESADLGYETRDVNTGGTVVFLAGLFGFVIIFFFFCFFMGRVINGALNKEDGPADKWHSGAKATAGGDPEVSGHQRENLKSNAAMGQQELGYMTQRFPQPRLDIDDGNQATADLHAREDLLLEHYSSMPGQPGVRIPIERAMELIAERGLPVAAGAAAGVPATAGTKPMYAAEEKPVVTAPLTSGFARTGYELDTIEARAQKMEYGKGESNAHAELKPVR